MYALRYIALVCLLVALFGPGMAVLLDPAVALMVGLGLLVLAGGFLDGDDEDTLR